VSLPVAILAGGLATRLRPTTERIPKALIDVAGRPFAEHQLDLLRQSGIEDVVFLVGYRGEQIRDAIGNGSRLGMRVEYVFDGPRLLGTGGALRHALPALGDTFFVTYGDSYLQCDMPPIESAFRSSGATGLMTVFRNDGRWDTSNILFADGRIVQYDKANRTPGMRHIDYGLGILTARALTPYPANQPFDLAQVYQDLLAAGGLAAFEVSERFYEIGSPAGLAETRALLAARSGHAGASEDISFDKDHA
jgi:MurNAc alpha-1-phosphate uridylyltransferase